MDIFAGIVHRDFGVGNGNNYLRLPKYKQVYPGHSLLTYMIDKLNFISNIYFPALKMSIQEKEWRENYIVVGTSRKKGSVWGKS